MKYKASQSTDQAPPPAETNPKAVFMRRATGMSFAEFKKVCIQRFREAGLLADEPRPSRKRRRSDGK